MDHEVAFVRIGFCKVDFISLAGLAEVNDISQIFLCRRRDIAVRRSKCVQLQIFFNLHLPLLQILFGQVFAKNFCSKIGRAHV